MVAYRSLWVNYMKHFTVEVDGATHLYTLPPPFWLGLWSWLSGSRVHMLSFVWTNHVCKIMIVVVSLHVEWKLSKIHADSHTRHDRSRGTHLTHTLSVIGVKGVLHWPPGYIWLTHSALSESRGVTPTPRLHLTDTAGVIGVAGCYTDPQATFDTHLAWLESRGVIPTPSSSLTHTDQLTWPSGI